jgi:hypothetical protein
MGRIRWLHFQVLMLTLFFYSTRVYLGLAARAFRPGRAQFGRLTVRRFFVLLGFVPLFGLVQLIHWAGFILDEVLFPGYRQVRIRKPVFVVGVPRSGTTHLHRVLAEDTQFTTFRAWECLFALSVTQRKFWLGLARLDRAIGRPGGRLLDWAQRVLFRGLDDVHRMALADPEEDYFALTPIMACFILILPFPFAEAIWRMGTFDRDVPESDRRRIMAYYEACLKKHLYVHGPDKVLLSKNASFSPLMGSLRERFPDARVLCCMRDPAQTVPSQLSSIEPGIDLFDVDPRGGELRDRFLEQMGYYYAHLLDVLGPEGEQQRVFLPMGALKSELATTVVDTYARLGLTVSEAYLAALEREAGKARHYRTAHRYSLEQFGLSRAEIRRRFAPVYARYDFSAGQLQPVEAERSTAPHPAKRPQPGTVREAEGVLSC